MANNYPGLMEAIALQNATKDLDKPQVSSVSSGGASVTFVTEKEKAEAEKLKQEAQKVEQEVEKLKTENARKNYNPFKAGFTTKW